MIHPHRFLVFLVAILAFSVLPIVGASIINLPTVGRATVTEQNPSARFVMTSSQGTADSAALTYSWNPKITCTPLIVRITDITANQTGSTSFSTSSFTPGITTTVPGGFAKRWLTPGPTPPGWIPPGPPCTVTNSMGTTSLFVQINGVGRNDLTNEDYVTTYDATNGGTAHTNTSDTTFNLFDPAFVPQYFTSCTTSTDPTCYGRVHAEIDHDWKAASYCGSGTFCDNATLASQTTTATTMIDVQGFVSWDPVNLDQPWHQFNGWEIHPFTAWKLSSAPPPPPPGTPDFTITASSSSPSFNSGSTGSFTVQLASVNSFAGTITLSSSASPTSGLTVICSPTSLTLPSAGSSTCTLNSSTPGTYTITVTGASGSLSHSTTVTVTVTVEKHDFAITANPASLALYPGASGTSTITIIAGSVFSRTISLTTSPSSGLTATIIPTSVDTSGTAVLTVNASTVGNYTATVTGTTRQGLSHSVVVSVRVVDFTITLGQTSLTLNVGVSGASAVTITAINGFNGTVALTTTASAGLYATLNPASVTGSATSTLTVSASLTGNYTVAVTGTSGSLSHATSVLKVKVVDFTISASPTAVGPLNAGKSGTSTITVNAVNGFIDTVTFTASPSPGLNAIVNPTTITGSGTATLTLSAPIAGNYVVTVTGTSDSLSHATATITVKVVDFAIAVSASSLTLNTGSSTTSTVTLGSLNGFAGDVVVSPNVSLGSGLSVACNPSDTTLSAAGTATSTCLLSASSSGTYSVTIDGRSDSLTHSVTMVVNVVDFTITANPASLTAYAGTQGTLTIVVAPVNGFSGPVEMTFTSSPGLTASLSPTSIIGSGSSTLTVNAALAGNYTVVVTALSGSLSHSVVVSVIVQDFAVGSSQAPVTTNAGQSGTTTIVLTAINGFTGTVTLSTTASTGLTASLNPTSISGSGTSTLTLTAAAVGNYTVTVTGTSGSLSRTTAVITVRVADFNLSVSSSSLTIVQGSTGTLTVTLTSLNGFTGSVDLSSAVSRSSGLVVSCGASSVVLIAGGTTAVTCTLTPQSNGSYSITLTGTSGSIAHQASVSVRVRQHA